MGWVLGLGSLGPRGRGWPGRESGGQCRVAPSVGVRKHLGEARSECAPECMCDVPGAGSCAFLHVDVLFSRVWELCVLSYLGLGTPEFSSGPHSALIIPSGQWVQEAGSMLSTPGLIRAPHLINTTYSLDVPGTCPGPALCRWARLCPPRGGGLGAKALWALGGRLGQGGPLEAGTAGPP